MSAELIAIIAAAVSLGSLVVVQTAAIRAELWRVGDHVADVDRGVARLEGTIDTLQSVLLSGRRRDDEGAAA